MMRLFLQTFLMIVGCLGSLWAQDIAGSKDHPIISRYPGSVIQWYSVDNYRPYRIPTGPVSGYRTIEKGIDTEGRLTRLYYTLDGTGKSCGEVYKNYREALASAGFELLAEGFADTNRGTDVGTRQWREVLFLSNPWKDNSGAVNEMARGSSTSGGGGSVVARKVRADSTVYVVISVYQFRDNRVSTLVDVVEVAEAETGLVVANAEAIGAGIKENGRVVLDGLFFDFDKATLQPQSKEALTQISAYLKALAEKKFYVVGHTDSKGNLAYNQNLSLERAKTVVKTLTENYGIPTGRLEAHGVGPLVPVFANGSDAGREKNRRVELVEQ